MSTKVEEDLNINFSNPAIQESYDGLSDKAKKDFKELYEIGINVIKTYPKWKVFVTLLKKVDFSDKSINDAEKIMAAHLTATTLGNEIGEIENVQSNVDEIVNRGIIEFFDAVVALKVK